MNILFDTHVFIWWDSNPEKLPTHILSACESTENTLFLSIASLWEMQIKQQLGKLELREPLSTLVSMQQATNGIQLLPIHATHVFALQNLPNHHKDPFDRLIIAQALNEKLTIATADRQFIHYPATLLLPSSD